MQLYRALPKRPTLITTPWEKFSSFHQRELACQGPIFINLPHLVKLFMKRWCTFWECDDLEQLSPSPFLRFLCANALKTSQRKDCRSDPSQWGKAWAPLVQELKTKWSWVHLFYRNKLTSKLLLPYCLCNIKNICFCYFVICFPHPGNEAAANTVLQQMLWWSQQPMLTLVTGWWTSLVAIPENPQMPHL